MISAGSAKATHWIGEFAICGRIRPPSSLSSTPTAGWWMAHWRNWQQFPQTQTRPVQALNIMTAPLGSSVSYQISAFAWRMKNWVRPLGLKALGLPCQLMGTGMAFPWDVICTADLASGHIVEDLKLGLELTAGGWPPLFCPSAVVSSAFPAIGHGRRQPAPTLGARPYRHDLNGAGSHRARDCAPQLAAAGADARHGGAAAGSARAADNRSCRKRRPSVPRLGCRVCLSSLAAPVSRRWRSPRGLPGSASAAMSCRRGPFSSLVPFVLGKLALYGRLLSRGPVSQWTRTDRK